MTRRSDERAARRRRETAMRVGFIYNCATDELLREYPELTLNLTDSQETIEAVAEALEAGGHSVIRLNADQQLPAALVETQLDIVFNIATGVYGDTRSAHVPAMLEYLRIPHTGSGVLAEAVCHHKPNMKMVVTMHGLRTAPFQVFQDASEALKPGLRFPLIVKLPCEGGSLGLGYDSIVYRENALRQRLAYVLAKYQQGALVEDFIDGREFTVTVLGNNPPYTLPVAELLFSGKKPIRLDEPDPSTFERWKRLAGGNLSFVPMESRTVAPADVSTQVADQIQQIAIAAYTAIGCRDWARIDLRMDRKGTIYILDVNLIPGIGPDYVVSKSAQAAGWTYIELVNRILQHAVERYPHLATASEPRIVEYRLVQ
jgi:D-alanine-D-alanine ligase-like ATP-grasp enzyme